MELYSSLPFELRERVRFFVLLEQSSTQRWDPFNDSFIVRKRLANLATVSAEWKTYFERWNFKTIKLRLGHGRDNISTFVRVMDNERFGHLEKLIVRFQWKADKLPYDGTSLDGEAQSILQLSIEELSELLAVLHRFESLHAGKRQHIEFVLRPIKKNGTIAIGSKLWPGPIPGNQIDSLAGVIRSTSKIALVTSFVLSPDSLPPPISSALIGQFPNLQHIGFVFCDDQIKETHIWQALSDFVRLELPSNAPRLSSLKLTLGESSFMREKVQYENFDRHSTDSLPEGHARPFIDALRDYSRRLQSIDLRNFTYSTIIPDTFLSIPHSLDAAPAVPFHWPNIREMVIWCNPVSPVTACKALFTAAGRAAAQMPVLQSFWVTTSYGRTLTGTDDFEIASASLLFWISRIAGKERFNYMSLEIDGLEEDPAITAAWKYTEKVRDMPLEISFDQWPEGTADKDEDE